MGGDIKSQICIQYSQGIVECSSNEQFPSGRIESNLTQIRKLQNRLVNFLCITLRGWKSVIQSMPHDAPFTSNTNVSANLDYHLIRKSRKS
ncbi:hypothetical protein AM1_A0126 (plasmid) [Acaryochloris marina MBIC11017]|uniref:Uncharacterized protein n=1 Tax=Acaryochloris marina (strain MBIC 11017) TaxID=329726 RepID=A8ZKD5_ACAM1|nr:hypothetical protein AM1_A0126 [Acaryochloris marina MBIC11017]